LRPVKKVVFMGMGEPAHNRSRRPVRPRYRLSDAGAVDASRRCQYNSVPDLPFKRPAWEKAEALARELHSKGVLTKLRDSAGQDVDAGCGQLRARSVQRISFR